MWLTLACLAALIVFYFVIPIIENYTMLQYYAKQGVAVPSGQNFVTGSLAKLKEYREEKKIKQVPYVFSHIIQNEYFKNGKKHEPYVYLQILFNRMVVIQDPEAMKEIYTTKANAVNKKFTQKDATYDLIQDAFVVSPTSEDMKLKRKICAHGFYKDKLMRMTYSFRDQTIKSINKWKALAAKSDGVATFDLVEQVSAVFSRIIIEICFGEDLEGTLLPIERSDGSVRHLSIAASLRVTLQDLFLKAGHPIRAFVGNVWRYALDAEERQTRRNALMIRDFITKYIRDRVAGKNKSLVKENADFLSHLLANEYFAKTEALIVDEIIDFFIVATQTTSNAILHLLMRMVQNPHYNKQMVEEIQNVVIEPYLEEEKPAGGKVDIKAAFAPERLEDMEFFAKSFNEVLRLDPVGGQALAPRVMTRNERLGQVNLRKGDTVMFHQWGTHHNPEEWQRPSEFLPERWDPQSPLYLTPKGTKRHPYSFSPFAGGDRICFGKTFAAYSSKTVASIILHSFDFEFVDKKWMNQTPWFNIITNYDEVVRVKATPKI